eukprot:671760-Prymnesium_polylepis.1
MPQALLQVPEDKASQAPGQSQTSHTPHLTSGHEKCEDKRVRSLRLPCTLAIRDCRFRSPKQHSNTHPCRITASSLPWWLASSHALASSSSAPPVAPPSPPPYAPSSRPCPRRGAAPSA